MQYGDLLSADYEIQTWSKKGKNPGGLFICTFQPGENCLDCTSQLHMMPFLKTHTLRLNKALSMVIP